MTGMAGCKPRPSGRGKPGSWADRRFLVLDVAPDDAQRRTTAGRGEDADELAGLERRREDLYRELGQVGDFRRGSLNLRFKEVKIV